MESSKTAINRCASLEFYRFLASLFIAAFHFEWIYIGSPVYLKHFYIWVEFYFILSGFFLAKNVTKSSKGAGELSSSIKYLTKQFKKLYPQYIIAFLFSFIATWFVSKWKFSDIVRTLFASKWEFLILQLSGFDNIAAGINNVTAYISALFVSSLILHYLIENHQKMFINFLGPLFVICFYSHIIQTYGNLSQWVGFENWYNIGILRGIAGMTVGALSYFIVTDRLRRYTRKFLNAVNLICIICCFCLVWLREYISFSDLLIFIPIFALIISIAYVKSLNEKCNDKRQAFYCYVGSLSYPIYLIHYGILKLMKYYLNSDIVYLYMIPFIVLAIVAGQVLKWSSHISQILVAKIFHVSQRYETKESNYNFGN